ncbi:MAG TPA: hypothetical protein VK658_10620 [Chryseolinea sp.]|nr:hypothetical protein [Chryseolinea sp.]
MPESTLDIVEYLYVQHERFAPVRKQLASANTGFSWSLSLQYSFLTYTLSVPDNDDQRLIPYYHWKRNMDDSANSAEMSSPDESLLSQTRELIHPVSYKEHRSIPMTLEGVFSEEIMNSIKYADVIAGQAYLCTKGDHYAPGFFSAIVLSEKGIHLEQVNHFNARSIAHKNDYNLRELKFFVPTGPDGGRMTLGSEKMGNMLVEFNDRSSANNRECGRLIRAKIDELQLQHNGKPGSCN